MRRCVTFASLAALLYSLVPAAQAKDVKADAYFGYSRVGANMYNVYTPGMNGWQTAVHVKPLPFVGAEADVSHYNQAIRGFSQTVTQVMFGPRVTVGAGGFSAFAHGLVGFARERNIVTIFPELRYTATSYAFGGGGDVPLFLGFKLRVTADYLGNSQTVSRPSPSHFRAGVGVAYHFHL